MSKRIGEVSSKYGYQPWKFDEDVQKTVERRNIIISELKTILIEKYCCTPAQVRDYFIEVLTDIGELEGKEI